MTRNVELATEHEYRRASKPVFPPDAKQFLVTPGCSCGWQGDQPVERFAADHLWNDHVKEAQG